MFLCRGWRWGECAGNKSEFSRDWIFVRGPVWYRHCEIGDQAVDHRDDGAGTPLQSWES